MKPAHLVLVGSLVANAALAFFLWGGGLGGVSGVPRRAEVSAEKTTTPARPEIGMAAATPEQLRDRLRALGLPEVAINELVRARIYARWEARTAELVAAAIQRAPLWRLTDLRISSRRILDPAERKELHELETAARNELIRVLGAAAADADGAIAAHFGFLPLEKAVLLAALESDYAMLRSDLRAANASIITAADREQQKLLEAERERDLAALLSPAEREALDLRRSPTASLLGRRMASFEPTEAEYRAIFAVQREFEARFPAVPMAGMGMVQRQRIDDQPELMGRIRTALGDERFAEWQLSGQAHYAALSGVRLRWDIPATTAHEIATRVGEVVAASNRIASDTTRPPDERRETLIRLAADTRAQVTARIGAAAADQYFRDVFWWDRLAAGSVVRINGANVTFSMIGGRTPPPGPAPAPRPSP